MTNKQYKLIVLVFFSLPFISNCQSTPIHAKAVDQSFDHWDSDNKEPSATNIETSDSTKSKISVLLPSEISNALMPPLKVELESITDF